MEKAEMIEKITAIGTCEDDVERRTLLAEFQTEATKDYDSFADSSSKNDELTAEITKLQEANMKLFLQIGSQDDNVSKGSEGSGAEESEEKLKFEDLFDEKGELK